MWATLSACASNSNEGAKDTGTKPSTNSETNSNEPTKLTIAVQSNPNVEDFNTNHFTLMVEKAMNVDLEFLEFPSQRDEAFTKLALMVSSGQALPDVINMALDETTAYDYASKGIFIKLDDYLNNPDIAVNFNKIAEKDFVYKNAQLPDGSVYTVPRYSPGYDWNEGLHRMWINSEWLTKLNLKAPTTTDELSDVLKAFVEKDPNGNGKKDDIGIVGSKDGWGQNPMVYLMNSFIASNPDKSNFSVINGEIIPAFTQPEWKQGLEYMYGLVKDGLLSPLSFTQDQTQMKALINVKDGMGGLVPSGTYSAFDLNQLENKMTLLAPLTGPNGVASTPQNPTIPDRFWFITKDSVNAELAFKVGDYMLSSEASLVSRFGEKGVDWSDDPAVTSQYLGDFEKSEGLKTKIAIINPQIWNNPQNKHWGDNNPSYRALEFAKTGSSTKKDAVILNATPNFQPLYGELYVPAFPKKEEVITKFSYTPEELKKIANSKTAIDAYVAQSAVAFITGNKPLSQWDDYIAEINKMGLEDYIATSQAAYDRTK
jgi:putative aldouronate transport system substrate-binding protein